MRKALVVGINEYPFGPLRGCVKDATEIATLLERNGDGSPNFDVRVLTCPPDQVTKGSLKESIDSLFSGDSEVALLYFSGHGSLDSAGGYIVTPDAADYDLGISMDEILGYANRSSARNKVIVLDCCHSGALGSPNINDGRFAQLSEGLTVLTASRSNESAIEVNGSGVFTSLIVDALYGGAADLRGYITPGALYSYVDSALGAWEQRPIFKTNVSRFVHLRQVEPSVSLQTLRKIIAYFETPEYEYQLDSSYEFTSENPVDENVLVFKDLQKYFSVGLVRPVGEEYMYFAAMNSKTCKLTALGYQYWRLVKDNKI